MLLPFHGGKMKKLFLTGIAALLLATGTAHSDDPKSGAETYCRLLKLQTDEAFQSCVEHPDLWTYAPDSSPYSEKDYIWDCVSYRWKWKEMKYYKTLAEACVMRPCRWADNWAMCANGNLGYVPRKLRRQQLRELGRVPRQKYVKAK
jgi:hypothetical protein